MAEGIEQDGGFNRTAPAPRAEANVGAYAPNPAGDIAQQNQDGLDLAALWHIFWSWRYLILATTGVGVAAAIAYSLLQTPMYRSTVVLELNPPTVPIFSGDSSGGDSNLVVPNTDREFLATQYGLLESRTLAERVVQELNLASEESLISQELEPEARVNALASRLANNVQIAPQPASRLVEVSYTADDPQWAARVVNGYAESFIDSTLERRYEATASARQFLQERLSQVREDLDESERELVEYAQAEGIIDMSTGDGTSSDAATLPGASLATLNAELAAAEQRRFAAEQRYRQFTRAGQTAEVSERTSALRQERARLEAEYRERSSFLQDDFPEMVRLRERIEGLNEAISREAGSVSSGRANTLRAEYQAALNEERSLRARVNELRNDVLDLRERSVQYNMLQRELDTNRSLYDALLERFNEIGVAGGVGTPQASIVDLGEIPGSPFTPNIPLNLALGLVLGLGLGSAAAFVLEFITDTIKKPEDVREKLKLPSLGVIPSKKRNEDLAAEMMDRTSAIAEAYFSLATALQFSSDEGVPKTVLVTSTRAEEGKSTTSLAVASNFAQMGKRVLLIDADLRRPSFFAEESTDRGLSKLIADQNSSGHIINTDIENLWLMPSGPVPPNPAQLLSSPSLRLIIDEARYRFDVVIVDAPPTHGFADAPLIASVCDAVLMVVESGKTRRRSALEAIERLRSSGSLILGVALTKYRMTSDEYGYRYYEGYKSDAIDRQPHELTVSLLGRRDDTE